MKKQFKTSIVILTILSIPFLLQYKVFDIAFNSFVDAYLSVTIFVAATLMLVEIIERLFDFKLEEFNTKNPKYQVLISSILGALPGCGGAIIVLTQFSNKKVSFGSTIAALTSTMGDASFLLLSKQPLVGIEIIILSMTSGIIFGYIVDFIHGRDFLKIESKNKSIKEDNKLPINNKITNINIIWTVILIPGIILGLTKTIFYGIEANYQSLEKAMNVIGFIGSALSVIMFYYNKNSITTNTINQQSHITKVINDTNFITFWVILSFLMYSYTTYLFDINLENLFDNHKTLLPLIAILIGFIPGCGPQIVVTTLYINNLIPLSAQIGNAISNDGDALFPAIAVSPKAAILATIYSSIPALIISYSYMAIFE